MKKLVKSIAVLLTIVASFNMASVMAGDKGEAKKAEAHAKAEEKKAEAADKKADAKEKAAEKKEEAKKEDDN